jgi:hypothetical protein
MGLITGRFFLGSGINFRPFLGRPYEAQRKLDEVGQLVMVISVISNSRPPRYNDRLVSCHICFFFLNSCLLSYLGGRDVIKRGATLKARQLHYRGRLGLPMVYLKEISKLMYEWPQVNCAQRSGIKQVYSKLTFYAGKLRTNPPGLVRQG